MVPSSDRSMYLPLVYPFGSGWWVGPVRQQGAEAGLQAREGSSRCCPRFLRHQCEEEMQAVASSDSRQGWAASQLPF